MKKLIFTLICLIISLSAMSQTREIIDTLYAPDVATDTFYHFPGYTDNIVGVLVDFRTIDDTTGARLNIGVGFAMFDTTFIQLSSSSLPATILESNDYLVGFEKIGMAFSNLKLKFTIGSSGTDKKYPIKITYDR